MLSPSTPRARAGERDSSCSPSLAPWSWGGFKGPPRDGVVELGYAVAPSWEGRGVATAAVRELERDAWAVPDVHAVLAHTLAQAGASGRVLEKAGFAYEGEVCDEQVGTAWRFRLERPRA